MKIIEVTSKQYGDMIGGTPESWTNVVEFRLDDAELEQVNREDGTISDELYENAIEMGGFAHGHYSGPGRTFANKPSYRIDPDAGDGTWLVVTQSGGWDV